MRGDKVKIHHNLIVFALLASAIALLSLYSIPFFSKQSKASETTTLTSVNADGNVFQAGAGQLSSLAPPRVMNGQSSGTNVIAGNYMYAFAPGSSYYPTSGQGQGFYSVNLSSRTWTQLASSPTNYSWGMNYVDGTDYIYFSEGKGLYRYNIAIDSWTTLAVPPTNAGNLQLTKIDGYIYYGGTSTDWQRYSIAGNSWESLSPAPSSPGSFTTDGTTIYRKAGTTSFYKYSIAANSWSQAADLNEGQSGGQIIYTGGDNIFSQNNQCNGGMDKYSIAGNTWATSTARKNGSCWGDASIAYDGDDKIYFYESNHTNFLQYSISTNTVVNLPNVASIGLSQAWIITQVVSGKIYATTNDNDVYKVLSFDISSKSWTKLEAIPMPTFSNPYFLETPASLVFNQGRTGYYSGYAGHGDRKAQAYDFSSGAWSNKGLNSLFEPGTQTNFVWDGDNYFYNAYSRYDIANDLWTALPSSPPHGVDTYFDNTPGNVFFDKNGNLWAVNASWYQRYISEYNVAAGTWSEKSLAPDVIAPGGAVVYDGDDTVYVASGVNSQRFYKYVISTDTWSSLAAIPDSTYNGANAIKAGNSIYLLKGGNNQHFFRYNIGSLSWETLDNIPVNADSPKMVYDGNDKIYVTPSQFSATLYQYSVSSGDWSLVTALAKGAGYSSYMSLSPTGKLMIVPGEGSAGALAYSSYAIGGDNKQRIDGNEYPVKGSDAVGGDTKSRAYINFDTSSIPNNAIVSDVKVKVNVTKAYGSGDTVKITSDSTAVNDTNYPNTDLGNDNLHGALTSSSTIVAASTDFQSTGSKTIDLGATGGASLQANLLSDHFSLGFVGSDETTDTTIFSSNEFLKSDLRPQLEITYTTDPNRPTNPTTVNGYTDSGKATALTSNNWSNAAHPYFEFSGALDADSGVAGYYVYFGTTADANPLTSGVYQAHSGAANSVQNFTASGTLVSGQTYYLRILTRDQSHNDAESIWGAFTYKADFDAPSQIEYVNVSPQGCSTASKFDFTWPTATDALSDIASYDYKNGSTGNITNAGNVLALNIAPYQEGDNIIYFRSRDNAGNVSPWQTAVYCSTGLAYINDGPTVTSGPSSVSLNWVSSKPTTSYVQVYEGNTYISEQGQTSYSISHSVKVVGLEAEKAYRYKLVWTDQNGNLGESNWYETQTATAPGVKDLNVTISSPSLVIISWTTNYPATNVIEYGVGNYDTSVNLSGIGSSFSQQLTGLSGGKDYQLRIKASTEDGTKFIGMKSFTTPPLPAISGIKFEPVTDQSSAGMKVTWTTNVDTTTTVFYGPKGEAKKEISLSDKAKDHAITISNLNDNTDYEMYATGTDQYGNSATSDTNSFKTALDSRPPKITDLVIDSTNTGSGADAKAQIAVSFKTDEPATAQVEYGEGSSSTAYVSKTQEDTALSLDHVVIISNLDASKIYHLRAKASDRSKNVTYSEDNAVITKKPAESAFNLILQSLSKAFGWLKIFN